MRKNGEQTKTEEKVDCLQGTNPVLPQGEGPARGNSRECFSGNKTFMSRTLQLPIFFNHLFLGSLVRGVQIFEPVGKKLLGRHALGGDGGGLSLDFGFWILNQRKEKNYIAYRGLILFFITGERPPRGNSREIFSSHFGSCSRFSRNTTFMSRTLQLPDFFNHFFWVRLVRGVQIFEPVGKKLLGRHAWGGDFEGLILYLGFWGLELEICQKKRETSTKFMSRFGRVF